MSVAERQIVSALARGESNAEIAAARGTSPRTVANQLRALFEKFAVQSCVQLLRRLTRTWKQTSACNDQ